jgi:hypothetical protein
VPREQAPVAAPVRDSARPLQARVTASGVEQSRKSLSTAGLGAALLWSSDEHVAGGDLNLGKRGLQGSRRLPIRLSRAVPGRVVLLGEMQGYAQTRDGRL